MSGRHERAFRALLRVYPRGFRAAYRDEMTRLFADQLRDARSMEGAPGVARLWFRTLVDLVVTAPAQHLEPKEVLVASPAGASEQPSIDPGGPSRRTAVLVSLIPLWTVLGLSVFGQSFLEPVFANPPGVLGLPFGVVMLGVALIWTVVGAVIVANVRSKSARGVALTLFAIPATILSLLTPGVILLIQGLP